MTVAIPSEPGPIRLAIGKRAALLLQGGPSRLGSEVRGLATQVKEAAEKLDLCPKAPRIPIILELKRYAQWSSRRDEGQRGLMTFLAGELTSSAEETVSVGALRRLLKGQRALVVFDGLDEVPSEQKDEVAIAIKRLIADLQVTSDVFALCTSRPQGYSGQFDNIPNVAEVELVPLPPAVALNCAETLLSAERHSIEAKAALDRLRGAFDQSTAVRELMRTPLQVHIMCVIVRSGHRPPERRWALFNVFYNVIRQREANRQLPDQQVAVVLQRETKLLKDVHARLGFVLHARAEKAGGAEAELSQQDFTALVHVAVELAKDEQVSELVATVMRAARERLVLINTPVAAGSYKFDVRQLQEFFAGEFVYGGVQQDEFGRRLKLLAGDQHWREVVHFVLSALAEQDRRNELSIAVQALAELDRGDTEGEEALGRALARGASVVAQLALDGVLDEDRNVRNMFRDLLIPLLASSDQSLLAPLVGACASRAWLREYIIAQTEERVAEQALGAASVLWRVVQDDDPIRARVHAWFARVTDVQLTSILWAEHGSERDLLFANWHVTELVARLKRAAWTDSGTRFLVAAIWGRRSAQISKHLGVSGLDDLRSRRHSASKELVRAGGLAVFEMTWNELSEAERRRLASTADALPDEGIFSLWKLAFRCLSERTRDSYLALFAVLGSDWSGARALPHGVAQRLGLEERNDSPQAFVAKLDRERGWEGLIGHAHQFYLVHRPPTGKPSAKTAAHTLRDLLERAPREGLELWMRTKVESIQQDLYPGMETAVANLLCSNPELAEVVSAALLPPLFLLNPTLRDVLRGHAGMQRLRFNVHPRPEREAEGKIDLDSDAFLVPRLAGDLVSSFWYASTGFLFPMGRRNLLERPRSEVVSNAVLPSKLRGLMADKNSPAPQVAGAAVLLALFDRDEWSNIMSRSDVLIAHAADDHTFGPAFAFCAELCGRLWEPATRSLVSRMVEQDARRQPHHGWDAVLARWRERSRAPLSSEQGGSLLVTILGRQ